MGKRKKEKLKTTGSFRRLSVGTIKAKTRNLSTTIAAKSMMDEPIIYNSIMEIAADAYCKGWQQSHNKKKVFAEKKKALIDKEFNQFLTEIDDITNENK